MSGLSRKFLVFYLKPQSLDVYSSKDGFLFHLDFPYEYVSHLDVINKEGLKNELDKKLSKLLKKAKSSVLLLSDDCLFTDSFASLFKDDRSDNTVQFVESLPLEKGDVISTSLEGESEKTVYATSKKFHDAIVGIIQATGLSVKYSAPAVVFFKVTGNFTPNADDFTNLKTHEKILRSVNLIGVKHDHRKLTIAVMAGFALILICLVIFYLLI